MKTIIMAANVAGASQSNARAWYFLPDSAISNAGKPFFIPETDTVAEAVLAPVIKINRLGKTIAPAVRPQILLRAGPGHSFPAPGGAQKASRGRAACRHGLFIRQIADYRRFLTVQSRRESDHDPQRRRVRLMEGRRCSAVYRRGIGRRVVLQHHENGRHIRPDSFARGES